VDESSVASWERGEHRPGRRCREIIEEFLAAQRGADRVGLIPK
jgi:hypothetical protein